MARKLPNPATSAPMRPGQAREKAATEMLAKRGIVEGSDAYHEAMQEMQAGKVPRREKRFDPPMKLGGPKEGHTPHGQWNRGELISEYRNTQAEVDGDHSTGNGPYDVGHGLIHPKARQFYQAGDSALYNARTARGVNWDTPTPDATIPGMMKLGGPKAERVSPDELYGLDGDAWARTFDRRDEMYQDGTLHPNAMRMYDRADAAIGLSRGVRAAHREIDQRRLMPPGMMKLGGPVAADDMAGLAHANAEFHAQKHGPVQPPQPGGEGSWQGVKEGGRGFANPAVQRAAQAARKGGK